MQETQLSLYESEQLRAVTGPAIRPGGLALTGLAMEFCSFTDGARLLDVGCGEGATVGFLRGHHRMKAVGVDVSSRLLKDGKSRDRTLPLARANGEHLPFGNGTLDGIICECVLSLLPDHDLALREFKRVLGRNGKLILSDIYLRSSGTGARGSAETYPFREEAFDGCLSGARPACVVKKLLSEAGFALMLWEDHTPLLNELAARLVLAHGSADALWKVIKAPCYSLTGSSNESLIKPGYYLLVAQKQL